MYWQGPVDGTFAELAIIFEQSHRRAVPALYTDADGTSTTPAIAGVSSDPAVNAQSARMAYSILRSMSSEQGHRELTLLYEPLDTSLEAGSAPTRRLDAYVDALVDRAENEALLLIVIGSNATSGADGKQWSLAQQRAYQPARHMYDNLQGFPTHIFAIAGLNGMYSNPVEDKQFANRNQYTRVTAVTIPKAHLQYAKPEHIEVRQRLAASSASQAQNQAQNQTRITSETAAPPRQTASTSHLQPQREPAQTEPRATAGRRQSEVAEKDKEIYQNEFGMNFVLIPAGSFIMGSPADELRRSKDERQHHVTLTNPFYMQATEVTQGQWRAVMEDYPAHFENWGWDYPVENVSWVETQEFIKRLNERTGAELYRLPTEAEWEYAARAGTTTAFYDTKMEPGEKGENEALGRYAWYFHNSDSRTHRVAQKQPNAWGLYDMHGNVWEWCNDWQGDYPFDPIVDPVGPPHGNSKIRRGGSYTHFPGFARSANRSWHHYKERSPNLGFRLVRDVGPAPQAPAPRPAAAPAPASDPCVFETTVDNGNMLIRKGIPDSNVNGRVYVERITPPMVVAGEPYDYTLRVHNNTGCDLYSVTVTEQLPPGFVLRGTRREADRRTGNTLVWQIQPMPAGTSETFVISGMANGAAELQYCGTVDFTLQTCGTTQVVQPQLALAQEMPTTSLLCDEVPVTFRLSNTGTGTAADVNLRVTLPAGLRSAQGQGEFTVPVGNLAAGASRDVTMMLQAERVGTYRVMGTALGARNLQATSNRTVTISSPSLRITSQARAQQYAGRPIVYDVSVTNSGNAPAQNVHVSAQIPSNLSFVKASNSGMGTNNTVAWTIPELAANQTITLSYTLHTSVPGDYSSRVTAAGHCAPEVAAAAQTRVEGIAAMLLEVADERDPLEVGETTVYNIVATNQGSIDGTGIVITCQLEDNLELVSADGATAPTNETRGNRIVFAPLPALAPNAQAIWRVTVRAKSPGDVRFSTQMNSNELSRPVLETEATTVY